MSQKNSSDGKMSDDEALRVASSDISSDFSDAIWDAAGKFQEKKSRDEDSSRVEQPTETLWGEDRILTFEEFCSSPEHMNFPPLSRRQTMVSDYMFGEDPKTMLDNGRNTAVLVWGKGAGKDTISVLMILYVVYVMLSAKNPQRLLGLPNNNSIDLLNVASSREQAETIFFDKLRNFVLHWDWLEKRYDIQVSGRFFSTARERKGSKDKVIITNDAIIFPKNIRAFSGSSESESLEGHDLFMFVLDEADAFKSSSVNRSAAKIYQICRTSAFSRFKSRYKGFIISYPRSKNGFILSLYEKTKKFLNVYSDIAMTWEVKPRELFSEQTFEYEGHKIPMDFYEEFRLDPMGAKRSYMCLAPMAETTFLEDPDKVDDAAKVYSDPLFEFKDAVKNSLITKTIIKSPFYPDRAKKYIIVLDLGLKKDPAAMSLMHREQDKVIVDFVTRWIPDPDKQIRVDLSNIEEIIEKIFDTLTVDGLYADHWQSALLVQKLKGKGRNAETVKLEYDDYETFKRLLYSGNIILPKNEALLEELKNLQLYSGKKVDHPDGGHNDLAITVVMGLKMLLKTGKGAQSSNMAAEGEYVGENINEAVDVHDTEPMNMDNAIVIDGIPILER
jgi:hypothetical protein